MKRTKFHYAILRYIHDIARGEFVNLGVILATENGFVDGHFTRDFSRLKRVFPSAIKRDIQRKVTHLERTLATVGKGRPATEAWDSIAVINEILAKLLPPDDSSLQFTAANGGVTEDVAGQAKKLFTRIVDEAIPHRQHKHESDKEVWTKFRSHLEAHDVLRHLTKKKIEGKLYTHQFDHCFQNGHVHVLQAVSFDEESDSKVADKAVHWLGRLQSLDHDNSEFHILVNKPRVELAEAFTKATKILEQTKHVKVVSEEMAETFAKEMAALVRDHNGKATP
ncbi:MAG: DUF3037 domain-containing protein [Leptospirales bacterium]|nr:DUF3037 domain-containing protein [Leptospirales bacterium]